MSQETDWDQIAALYADHSIPLTEIARRFGVPRSTISARAGREGWPARKPHRRRLTHKPSYRIMINRMFRALDRQMRNVEERLAAEDPDFPDRDATDRERDARTLAALARTLEKLRDLEREAIKAGKADADDAGKTPDTEGLRKELECRLDRLMAAAAKGGISGQPD